MGLSAAVRPRSRLDVRVRVGVGDGAVTQVRSGGFGSLSPAPLALGIKMIRIQRPRAMISWHEPCLDPPWALLPLEPRVRPLVGHFGLASIGTERTPHRPAYIIG